MAEKGIIINNRKVITPAEQKEICKALGLPDPEETQKKVSK